MSRTPFAAKKPTRCRDCGQQVSVGEPIMATERRSVFVHATCPDQVELFETHVGAVDARWLLGEQTERLLGTVLQATEQYPGAEHLAVPLRAASPQETMTWRLLGTWEDDRRMDLLEHSLEDLAARLRVQDRPATDPHRYALLSPWTCRRVLEGLRTARQRTCGLEMYLPAGIRLPGCRRPGVLVGDEHVHLRLVTGRPAG